jgi:hypothetical protein
LLTTFRFAALQPTDSAVLDLLESAGSPVGHTVVWDGTTPETDVVGSLGSAEVTISCMECPGDLDGDASIGLIDLGWLLTH